MGIGEKMIVKLRPWEYEYASHIGIRRFTANWNKQDASYYDKAKMEDNRTAQVAAAIGELAVAKATNQYWHASIWDESRHDENKYIPDVGNCVEVRRVRTQDGPVVREKDLIKNDLLNNNLYIFGVKPVGPEFREVEILGWTRAIHGWHHGIPTPFGKVIPQSMLSPVETWQTPR